MTISEKVAYLKGLAEGLGLDTEKSKEAKLISVMVGILEEVGLSIDDLEENALALGEEIDALSDDLAEIETFFAPDSDDEHGHHHHHHHGGGCGCGGDDMDDFSFGGDEGFPVLDCPNCEAPIQIDEDVLETGTVVCDACQGRFTLDFEDVDDDDIEDEDEED